MLQLIVRKMLPSRDKWLIEFQCLQILSGLTFGTLPPINSRSNMLEAKVFFEIIFFVTEKERGQIPLRDRET